MYTHTGMVAWAHSRPPTGTHCAAEWCLPIGCLGMGGLVWRSCSVFSIVTHTSRHLGLAGQHLRDCTFSRLHPIFLFLSGNSLSRSFYLTQYLEPSKQPWWKESLAFPRYLCKSWVHLCYRLFSPANHTCGLLMWKWPSGQLTKSVTIKSRGVFPSSCYVWMEITVSIQASIAPRPPGLLLCLFLYFLTFLPFSSGAPWMAAVSRLQPWTLSALCIRASILVPLITNHVLQMSNSGSSIKLSNLKFGSEHSTVSETLTITWQFKLFLHSSWLSRFLGSPVFSSRDDTDRK